MKRYIPFVFRSSLPEFLLVNSAGRWFITAASFEGTFLSSFLYLLTRTLTIFSSDGIGAVVMYLDFHLTKRALCMIGWFLVTCAWSNSNVSRPGYNCAVVVLAPNTTARDQCMNKLKMTWSSAHAHVSLTFEFCTSIAKSQETVNFNTLTGAFSVGNVTVDFYNYKWIFCPLLRL